MNILAIDTTGKHLTIALKTKDTWDTLFDKDCNLNHSVVLNSKIDQMMKKHNVTFEDLDCYAVNVGVGSFTGIRVGIATIKGFCMACPKKLVQVNTFEILAYNEGKSVSVFVPDNRGFYFQEFKDGVAKANAIHIVEKLPCQKEVVFDNDTDYTSKFTGLVDKKVMDNEFCQTLNPLYVRKSQAEESK